MPRTVTLADLAGVPAGGVFDTPLWAVIPGGRRFHLEDMPPEVLDVILGEIPCLRCHYNGFETCAFSLIDECRSFLFVVSSALDILERLLRSKVKSGTIHLHDGIYIDRRDIRNDVSLFVCRVRDNRKFLNYKVSSSLNVNPVSWNGFIGEHTNDTFALFGGGAFGLTAANEEFQNESPHKDQLLAIGQTLAEWDSALYFGIIAPLNEWGRPGHIHQINWKRFKKSMKQTRTELCPPNMQRFVEQLEASIGV